MAFDEVLETIREIESKLRVAEDFCINLIKEDDWSLIIKLHSLMEAAVSHLLVVAVNDARLTEVFSWLELSNQKTGKIAFVKALDLLEKKHRRYIITLSQIRNDLVHNVKNVNFSLRDYVDSLQGEKLKNFIDTFNIGVKEVIEIEDIKLDRNDIVKVSPQHAIWLGGLHCLEAIGLQAENVRLERQIAQYKK